ncbi:MAG: ribosome maturation factor RimP [Marmoricola sp.]
MAPKDTPARLEALLDAPLSGLGLDLEAVELSPAGKRQVLRIAVDRDGGITMDDVAEATRVVSELLDQSDVMGETPYTLEVSSPGVDRPLTLPRHWRRNAGRLVKATLADGEVVTGRVVRNDDQSVVLRLHDKRPESERTVPFADIRKAKIEIEFKAFDGFDDDEGEE